MDDLKELSPHVPRWFHPVYFVLIVAIWFLGTVVKAGPVRGTAWRSAVSMVVIDTYSYVLIYLTAILLLIAICYAPPWTHMSFNFLAPLVMFLAAVVSATVSDISRRRFLNLWLRLGCMACVSNLQVDKHAFRYVLHAFLPDVSLRADHDALALLQADAVGGIPAALSCKGSDWPLLSVLKIWWRHGTPIRPANILVWKYVSGRCRLVLRHRYLDHTAALRALLSLARKRMDEEGSDAPTTLVSMKVVTCFSQSAATLMHSRFGFIWRRASGKTTIDESAEAWWFLGAELVQAIKAVCGISFLTSCCEYDDIAAMWEWICKLGYEWRKPLQIPAIATELARLGSEDPTPVVHYALGLAGEGKVCIIPREEEMNLAIEANRVAALGLAVSSSFRSLEKSVHHVSSWYTKILVESPYAVVGLDRSRVPAIVGIPPEKWPQRQLARMIVEWVSSACEHPFVPAATSTPLEGDESDGSADKQIYV